MNVKVIKDLFGCSSSLDYEREIIIREATTTNEQRIQLLNAVNNIVNMWEKCVKEKEISDNKIAQYMAFSNELEKNLKNDSYNWNDYIDRLMVFEGKRTIVGIYSLGKI